MNLFELTGGENHPAYQALEVSNGNRQYDFLRSLVDTALHVQRSFLSSSIIKSFNYHAIACLHSHAGEYRPCRVSVGDYEPPEEYRVQSLMDDFINQANREWEAADAVTLAAYTLWSLNFIHPFINGNGRTARAACYFVLCVKVGGWLPGRTILPELLRRERARYIAALKEVDVRYRQGHLDVAPLHALLAELLVEQLNGATEDTPEEAEQQAPALPPPPD